MSIGSRLDAEAEAGYRAFLPAPLPPDQPTDLGVNRLADAGILREITGYTRNRRFRFDPYLQLFEEPAAGGEGSGRLVRGKEA